MYDEYESDPEFVEIEITSSGDNQIPAVTKLGGNHPNPFNPETEISYQLAEKSHVTIEVYNIKGQSVKLLVNEETEAGIYHVIWDGKDEKGKLTSSGIYYYRMTTEKYSSTRKMILMK